MPARFRRIIHQQAQVSGQKWQKNYDMIQCILAELLKCKIHEKCLCLLMSALVLGVAITQSGNIRLPWFVDNS